MGHFLVQAPQHQKYQGMRKICEQRLKQSETLQLSLAEKQYENKNEDVTLTKKEIRTALDISKKEARQLYREMNFDNKKGISEFEIELYHDLQEAGLKLIDEVNKKPNLEDLKPSINANE